jgi:steroid 5-alpha reductase family enzyme
MTRQQQNAGPWLVVLGAVSLAALVAWLVGQGGATVAGLPVMACCAVLAFVIQWLAFIPAYRRQTEHFYDLVGSLSYIAVTGFALLATGAKDPRSIVLSLLVFVWATRLGSFLFRRVRAAGSDERFADIRTSAARFFSAWTLQGLWVFLTLSAALGAIATTQPSSWGAWDSIGLLIWALGFALELVADLQKQGFRRRHPNRYIDTGLWAWSRHPNYFGEIVLWTGVAVMASSTLQGWQWVSLISPVFVTLLLTRVSGIPILERRADARWGHDEGYLAYKIRTPVLVPHPPSPNAVSRA